MGSLLSPGHCQTPRTAVCRACGSRGRWRQTIECCSRAERDTWSHCKAFAPSAASASSTWLRSFPSLGRGRGRRAHCRDGVAGAAASVASSDPHNAQHTLAPGTCASRLELELSSARIEHDTAGRGRVRSLALLPVLVYWCWTTHSTASGTATSRSTLSRKDSRLCNRPLWRSCV